MKVYLQYAQDNETIAFATQELERYIKATKNNFIFLHNETVTDHNEEESSLSLTFGLDEEKSSVYDDYYRISINKDVGSIVASNARSVLLAVYALLRKIGFRFLTPLEKGTFIPEEITEDAFVMEVEKTASLRHRGVCIEGADSLENVLDFIDWLPKAGYNSFFLQFIEPFDFMNRWYTHMNNPLYQDEKKTQEFYQSCYRKMEREMERRSLILHTAGHGWTSEAIGYPSIGWMSFDYEPDEETISLLAENNGVRGLNGGVPLNTNLCYSNPKAVAKFADAVIAYSKKHPTVDYIHIWLADDMNHMCECENCRDVLPTDHYVQVLNEIDRRMEEEQIGCKLVFLLYQELLYAPIKERLNNPSRFTLMFAPITRSFLNSYPEKLQPVTLPEYKRNRMRLPSSVEENLTYLLEWQKCFDGDSFVYDYPLGRAHYGDLGYVGISRIIAQDIKHLNALKLNGYISCQELRAAFPNSMPNYVMGHLLFDTELTYAEIEEEYFKAAYGDEWKIALAYVDTMSKYSNCDYFNGKGSRVQETLHANYTKLYEEVQERKQVIAKINEEMASGVRNVPASVALFWEILAYHTRSTELLGEGLMHLSGGNKEEADKCFAAFCELIQEKEATMQPHLDVFRVTEIGVNFAGFKRPAR